MSFSSKNSLTSKPECFSLMAPKKVKSSNMKSLKYNVVRTLTAEGLAESERFCGGLVREGDLIACLPVALSLSQDHFLSVGRLIMDPTAVLGRTWRFKSNGL